MNILEEVQIYVQDRLNADEELSGLCPFIFENKRDIDYEIKSAIGKQGIVGLVMTPKATFAGAYEDKSLAWQIDELEIDIIENVTVNRGKKTGFITGQDASMRLFDVLCPLSGDNEGMFNAVSYEEGEDNSLLVNKCVLKCLIHKVPQPPPPPPFDPSTNYAVFSDGNKVEGWENTWSSAEQFSDFCYENDLDPYEITEAFVYQDFVGFEVFFGKGKLKKVVFGPQVETIQGYVFDNNSSLEEVLFKGRTLAQVQAMSDYPWGIEDTSVIQAELPTPDPTLTRAYYADGTMVERDITTQITRDTFEQTNLVKLEIGSHAQMSSSAFAGNQTLSSVVFNEGTTSIGGQLSFDSCPALTQITIPDSVTTIGDGAFGAIPNLTEFRFPQSLVESIGSNAFSDCQSLSSVAFGGDLLEIQESAFYNCTSLKNFNSNYGVYINDGTQTIGQYAFYNSGMEKLSFDNIAAMGIDRNAFAGCNQLNDVVVRGVTTHEAMSLENYPWGISNESIIRGDKGI